MKLVFTKLETDANEIKVTFDGSTWRPYSVADIKRTGYIEFTEEDCPDLTKIKIKGKFARFNSVESVSDVELEQGVASRSLAESVQRIDSFIPSTVSETNKLVDGATLMDNVIPITSSDIVRLYQNTNKEYLTKSGMTFTASKTGLLQVSIFKKLVGNSLNISINSVCKNAYANYWGENVWTTLSVPVKNGDIIEITDDVGSGASEENHYLVAQVNIV